MTAIRARGVLRLTMARVDGMNQGLMKKVVELSSSWVQVGPAA